MYSAAATACVYSIKVGMSKSKVRNSKREAGGLGESEEAAYIPIQYSIEELEEKNKQEN